MVKALMSRMVWVEEKSSYFMATYFSFVAGIASRQLAPIGPSAGVLGQRFTEVAAPV
jgi:hypothetical protein